MVRPVDREPGSRNYSNTVLDACPYICKVGLSANVCALNLCNQLRAVLKKDLLLFGEFTGKVLPLIH